MLQRVAIKNYKIFNKEQILDFRREKTCPNYTDSLFTLVGENGCGKSTLLNLIGLASNFGCEQGIQDVRVCDKSNESFVKCEYSIDNWSQLPDLSGTPLASNYPEFKLWFLDGLLKIPSKHVEYLQRNLGNTALDKLNLTLVTGFKRVPEANSNEIISKFLYVKCDDKIIAVNQPINARAEVGVFPCCATEDLLNWRNPEKLQATELDFQVNRDAGHNSGTDADYTSSHPPKVANTVNSQSTMVLDLIRTVDPIERGTIWNKAINMFHELTGDKKITIEYKPSDDSITIIEKLDEVKYEKDDLPEGFFYAFIVAFLLVNPLTSTLLLDEPTRGMHPLQIRRLRRILSRESRQSNKVIIVSAHAPDMLYCSPIDQIFRFRRLTSGFSEISRVSRAPSERYARFVCTGETRELFFSRRIIWVEGGTDRRFCDAMLKLIEEGSNLLWNALQNSVPQPAAGGGSLQNLFASPAYQKKVFSKDVFEKCRERARSCSVLQFGGKMNIGKVIKICQDLNVPYGLIVDLDALLPGSKKDVSNAFNSYLGDWSRVPVLASDLITTVKAPASYCVKSDSQLKSQLQSCTNADQVIEFYEKQRIFGWRVGSGEIEDVVQVTKKGFKKEDWRDLTFGGVQNLIEEMLTVGSQYGPNPETLRCFSFILDFLSQNLSNI